MSIDRRKITLGVVCLWGMVSLLWGADLKEVYSDKSIGMSLPTNPIATDVNADGKIDIIVTDNEGMIAAISAHDGLRLWKTKITDAVLTEPVAGDFYGDNTIDIAVCSSDGQLHIIDASTGKKSSSFVIGEKIIFPPTIVSIPREGTNEDKDLIVIASDDKKIQIYEIVRRVDKDEIHPLWTKAFITDHRLVTPITAYDINKDKKMDLIFGRADDRVTIVDGASGELLPRMREVNVGRPIKHSIAIGEDRSSGESKLFFVVYTEEHGIGQLDAYYFGTWSGRGTRSPIWSYGLVSKASGPPILTDVNGDLCDDVIIADGLNIVCVGFKAKGEIWQGKTIQRKAIVCPPALIKADSGADLVTLQDGLNYLYFPETAVPEGDQSKNIDMAHIKIPNISTFSPIVLDADGDEYQDLFFITPKAKISLYSTDVKYSKYPLTWFSYGANFSRTNSVNEKIVDLYNSRLLAYRGETDVLLEKLEGMYSSRQWREALEIADRILSMNPSHEKARSLRIKSWIRYRLILLMLYVVAIISLLTYVILKTLAYVMKKRDLKKANLLIGEGRFEETIDIYARQFKKFPNDVEIIKKLSDVLIQTEQYDKDSSHVLENAHKLLHKDKYLIALIDSELRAGNTGHKALGFYLEGRKIYPHKADLELMIGKIFKEHGRNEEAIKALRAALHLGKETQELFELLSDLYLATNNHTVKAYHVFKNVYPYRKDDQEFLKAFCESSMDAKVLDDRSEELANIIIEKSPRFVPAYLLSANVNLHANKIPKAYQSVEKVLEIDPDNSDGLLVMSLCFLAQDRTDTKAEECFLKTLEHFADNGHILRALAHIYASQNRTDEAAGEIYRSARSQNPKDTKILRMLAQVADINNDIDLAISAVETLNDLGHYEEVLNLQLAKAYIAKGDVSVRREKCFLEALRREPSSISLCEALSVIFIDENRNDKQAISIFEGVLAHRPDSLKVATHLIRAYMDFRLFSQALATAKEVMEFHPTDNELLKLYAQANLHSDQLGEAIAEYERLYQKNPNDRETVVSLATAYSYEGRTDEKAYKIYTQAIQFSPDSVEIHLILSRYHLNNGNVDTAIEELQSAVLNSPQQKQKIAAEVQDILDTKSYPQKLRWFLIELLIDIGHLNEAAENLRTVYQQEPSQVRNVIEGYTKILRKDESNLTSLFQVGSLLRKVGKIEFARQALEKAHNLFRQNTDVMEELSAVYESILRTNEDSALRLKLGEIYYSLGELDKAIGCFQRTMKNYKTEEKSTKMLGKCFVSKGMLDLGLQEFQKIKVDDELKDILYDLGLKYEAKNDLVGAKNVYEMLFAADINYKNVKSKFEMLAGTTSDPKALQTTAIIMGLSEEAKQRYQFLDEIGRGAMGLVYKAKDNELDEIVALKILPDDLSNNPEAIKRFKQEARSARKLSHPNIVRIHDIGEEMGRKYISMEFVDGADLKVILKKKRKLDPATVIVYGKQMCQALGYAHKLGIIHRDVKPANIMINKDNQVKVTDFGIAKVIESADATIAGAIIGTPLYMSPEQVQGKPVDNRADIYSLGVLLYELISGRPPFTSGDLAYQHINVEPPPLEDIPESLYSVIRKCLEKQRNKRWHSADEMAEALDKIVL